MAALPPVLQMRHAQAPDCDLIQGQILDGARKGHFDRRMLVPKHTLRLHDDINSIISRKCRSETGLGAEALIFSMGDSIIGHAILSEVKDIPGAEIYAFALDECWKGQGLGGAMLDMIVNRYLPTARVLYARCFYRSVVMYEMLISRGFDFAMTTRSGLRVLSLAHPDAKHLVPF